MCNEENVTLFINYGQNQLFTVVAVVVGTSSAAIYPSPVPAFQMNLGKWKTGSSWRVDSCHTLTDQTISSRQAWYWYWHVNCVPDRKQNAWTYPSDKSALLFCTTFDMNTFFSFASIVSFSSGFPLKQHSKYFKCILFFSLFLCFLHFYISNRTLAVEKVHHWNLRWSGQWGCKVASFWKGAPFFLLSSRHGVMNNSLNTDMGTWWMQPLLYCPT